MNRLRNSWRKIAAIIGSITLIAGLYATAPSLGFNLPRFATNQEVDKVEDQVKQVAEYSKTNRILILQGQLFTVILELARNDVIMIGHTSIGQRIPPSVLRERARLIVKKRQVESDLRGLGQ